MPRVYLHDFATADAEAMGKRAAAVEAAGWDGLLLADSQNLTPDVFIALTMAAAATSRLELGTAVTNPMTRHPAVVASAISSLQAASGGRAVLGLGRGDSALLQLGLRPQPRVAFQSDARRIRAYLHGHTVDEAGYPSRIQWLPSSGCRPVPLQIFASGPLLTADAALVADRLTIVVGARPERISARVQAAKASREAAGLDPASLDVGAYLIVGVDDDPTRARDLVRGNVGIFAHFQRDDTALDPADEAVVAAVTQRWEEATHGLASSAQSGALTDDFVDHFALVGSHDHCVSRLRELFRVGIDHLVLIGASRDIPQQTANRNTTAILTAVTEAARALA
ncbi:MAG TPA: LLM class flavin-dependent oxidoreductase [Nocardioidaceae bacterium]|nr:LLM class flavin-dependent oxidoreductase [Nocardioidaceae bacterium]